MFEDGEPSTPKGTFAKRPQKFISRQVTPSAPQEAGKRRNTNCGVLCARGAASAPGVLNYNMDFEVAAAEVDDKAVVPRKDKRSAPGFEGFPGAETCSKRQKNDTREIKPTPQQ